MILNELLSYLRQNNVTLWVEGDRLRYKGSGQVLTPELLEKIADHKTQIITALREADTPTTSINGSTNSAHSPHEPPQLEYRFVGKCGLKVSELALGPYSATMLDLNADDIFPRLLDTYLAAGGNHIDLSNVYPLSETRMGKWLQGKTRDDLIIATKVGMQAGEGPNHIGLSRKHIMSSVEQSLRALGTDYIDIYYCHIWDGGTPLEETISTLNDLVRAGKVRYLGLSNFTGWQMQKAIDIAKYTQHEAFICLQTQYNLLDRYPEWEQIPVCQNEGLGLLAWGSLSAGWLTGRYRRDMASSNIGDRVSLESVLGITHNSYEFKNNERTWRTIDVLLEVATECGRTPSQVALNWLKERPGVMPILGPRNVEQLREALGATGWSMTKEQYSRLEEASRMAPIMPHMFVESVNPPDRI